MSTKGKALTEDIVREQGGNSLVLVAAYADLDRVAQTRTLQRLNLGGHSRRKQERATLPRH